MNETTVKKGISERWDFESNPVFKGVYLSKEKGGSPETAHLNFIKLWADKKEFSLLESATLKTGFSKVIEGDKVRITYSGMRDSKTGKDEKTGKPFSYKVFKVEVVA